MLKKIKVRRSTVPNKLTWPSTKKSDDSENFVTTGSVDGCSVPGGDPVCRDTLARGHHMIHIIHSGSIPLWELPERGQSLTSNRL